MVNIDSFYAVKETIGNGFFICLMMIFGSFTVYSVLAKNLSKQRYLQAIEAIRRIRVSHSKRTGIPLSENDLYEPQIMTLQSFLQKTGSEKETEDTEDTEEGVAVNNDIPEEEKKETEKNKISHFGESQLNSAYPIRSKKERLKYLKKGK